MTNTPRTDSARRDEHDPYMAIASECSKLERELNVANERIKRLEEWGDYMRSHSNNEWWCENWDKAKEAKP